MKSFIYEEQFAAQGRSAHLIANEDHKSLVTRFGDAWMCVTGVHCASVGLSVRNTIGKSLPQWCVYGRRNKCMSYPRIKQEHWQRNSLQRPR